MYRPLTSLCLLCSFAGITTIASACSDGDDSGADSRSCTILNSSASIAGNATLDEECYTVSRSLTVDSGELTIAAGTTLYFDAHAGITIAGNARLVVSGNDDAQVELRGDRSDLGFWRGLRFTSPGPHHLEKIRIADAGSRLWDSERPLSRGGIVVGDDSVEIEIVDAEFENHAFSAITSDASLATIGLSGSLFAENDYPLRLHADQLDQLARDNSFSGNRHNVVRIHTDIPVTRDASWSALQIPYQFQQPVIVESSVTIGTGTTIYFERHAGLDVDGGSLHAVSTATDPIRFLGTNDTRGHWRGLRLANSPAIGNLLVNVELRHAGSERWEHMWSDSQATILVDTNGHLEINHALLADGDYHAISHRHSIVEGCNELTIENHYRRDTFAYDDDGEDCFK